MEYKVQLKKVVMKKLKLLMKHIKSVNDDNEIGAWLTGEWSIVEDKDNSRTAVLILDDIVIPKQKVSRAEVDISPESMADLAKEKGLEFTNRIKAHWHIHPFGTGKTNWSGTDESKIKSYMDPEKGRQIFVFLLSSYDWMKARIEMNVKTIMPFDNENIQVSRLSMDDIEPSVYEEEVEDEHLIDELKNEIKENVKSGYENGYVTSIYGQKTDGMSAVREKLKKENYTDDYRIHVKKNRIIVVISEDLYVFMNSMQMFNTDIGSFDEMKTKGDKIVLIYKLKTEEMKEVNKCMQMIDNEFCMCLEEYYECCFAEDYNKSYGVEYSGFAKKDHEWMFD